MGSQETELASKQAASDIPDVRRRVSDALAAFLVSWQPRQRRTAGLQSVLFTRLHNLLGAHAEWRHYDLLTHALAALHLIIENDRLTGGHTETQIVDELAGLVAFEKPNDPPETHREVAQAVVDVLTNARGRRLRFTDQYLHAPNGTVAHPEQTFHFVRYVGADDTTNPTLRATSEAINLFQNLYEFDPSDRVAAERYRSQRMLDREDYDEVLSSIERRATTVHGLQMTLNGLLAHISHNVRDVDYAARVIPVLDESLRIVIEQIDAEERFAEAVNEYMHRDAPDLTHLQRISSRLQALIRSLGKLRRTAGETKGHFEHQQDRQLFTYRRITINPQSQVIEPLLTFAPDSLLAMTAGPLAMLLGPRRPRILNLAQVIDRTIPKQRSIYDSDVDDPFDFGGLYVPALDLDPAHTAAVADRLAAVTEPVSLPELLSDIADDPELSPQERQRVAWLMALTVASAYGVVDATDDESHSVDVSMFDHDRLKVVASGESFENNGICGAELIVVPARSSVPASNQDVLTSGDVSQPSEDVS